MSQLNQNKASKVAKRHEPKHGSIGAVKLNNESIFLTAPKHEVESFFDWLKQLPSPKREEVFIDCCIRARLPSVALAH